MNKGETGMPIGLIGIGVIIVAILIVLMMTIHIVGPGEKGVLLTWGAVQQNSLPSGIYFTTPIAQTIININTQTQMVQADASSASSDLQDAKTTVALNFKVQEESAAQLYKEVGMNYADKVIAPAIQEAVKAATAQFTAAELVQKREAVRQRIEDSLRTRLPNYYLQVQNMSITNFSFSEQFNKAIEDKVTAEQQAQKAQNDLTRIKIEAEQTVATAEAQSKSTKLQADASAYKIKQEAEAQAYQIQTAGEAQGKALAAQRAELTPELVQYQIAQKWLGNVPTITMGGQNSIPLINLDNILK